MWWRSWWRSGCPAQGTQRATCLSWAGGTHPRAPASIQTPPVHPPEKGASQPERHSHNQGQRAKYFTLAIDNSKRLTNHQAVNAISQAYTCEQSKTRWRLRKVHQKLENLVWKLLVLVSWVSDLFFIKLPCFHTTFWILFQCADLLQSHTQTPDPVNTKKEFCLKQFFHKLT